MTKSASRGRAQMLAVIALSALLACGAQMLHIPHGSRLAYGLYFCVGLLSLAVLFYVGHGRFRVGYGLLLLASAIALVFVGLTRAIDGGESTWPLLVMSAAFAYCCWVILVSKSARRFLAETRGGPRAREGRGLAEPRRGRPATATAGHLQYRERLEPGGEDEAGMGPSSLLLNEGGRS